MVFERDRLTATVDGIGERGIDLLQAARVLVVGAGGLGSPALAYLSAAGVGTLGISDPDRVEQSNLQRQVIHPASSLGQIKSVSAAATVHALNPNVRVQLEPKITADNARSIIGAYDLVIDATDNFSAKYLLADTCAEVGRPHLWGTLVAMNFQISVFAEGLTLRDLYPAPPPAGTTPTSRVNGVLGAVCGQAGSILATEAIKMIVGVGEPLIGKLLIVDAASGKWNVVHFGNGSPKPATVSGKDK